MEGKIEGRVDRSTGIQWVLLGLCPDIEGMYQSRSLNWVDAEQWHLLGQILEVAVELVQEGLGWRYRWLRVPLLLHLEQWGDQRGRSSRRSSSISALS